jgi:hypothetical protein
VDEARPTRPELSDLGPGGNKKPRDSLVPVLFVLGCGIALVLIVIGCAGVAGLYVLLAISGVVCFGAVHYLLWGARLSRSIRRNRDAESPAGRADE